MRRGLVLVLVLVLVGASLAACHLGEEADAPTCAPGTHPLNGYCAADRLAGPVVTISPAPEAGASCVVSPESITVAPNGEFSFKNDDSVEHVITGADGQAWATARAGQSSSFVGISRAGSWPYLVSGCAKGGTVVVQ